MLLTYFVFGLCFAIIYLTITYYISYNRPKLSGVNLVIAFIIGVCVPGILLVIIGILLLAMLGGIIHKVVPIQSHRRGKND